jgi:hypothetical protein
LIFGCFEVPAFLSSVGIFLFFNGFMFDGYVVFVMWFGSLFQLQQFLAILDGKLNNKQLILQNVIVFRESLDKQFGYLMLTKLNKGKPC